MAGAASGCANSASHAVNSGPTQAPSGCCLQGVGLATEASANA